MEIENIGLYESFVGGIEVLGVYGSFVKKNCSFRREK